MEEYLKKAEQFVIGIGFDPEERPFENFLYEELELVRDTLLLFINKTEHSFNQTAAAMIVPMLFYLLKEAQHSGIEISKFIEIRNIAQKMKMH